MYWISQELQFYTQWRLTCSVPTSGRPHYSHRWRGQQRTVHDAGTPAPHWRTDRCASATRCSETVKCAAPRWLYPATTHKWISILHISIWIPSNRSIAFIWLSMFETAPKLRVKHKTSMPVIDVVYELLDQLVKENFSSERIKPCGSFLFVCLNKYPYKYMR